MKEFITNENVIHISITIGIFLGYILLKPLVTYLILKVFNWKKKRQEIKEMALYKIINQFFVFLGVYSALMYWGVPEKWMFYINKAFKINTILIFTYGFAESITAKNSFIRKMQDRMHGENTDGMLRVLAKTIKVVIYIIGGFLIVMELGYNLNGLATGLGIGTVVITLAAQDTAKSLFSGLTIAVDKPFVIGDWIKVGEYAGKVEEVTFRSTRIRTMENTMATIPNRLITEDTLVNETKRKRRRYSTDLIFSFDTPLDKLKTVIAKIDFMLKHNEDVHSNTVNVKFIGIEDSGYHVLIYCFTNTTEYLKFLKQSEYINYQIMEIIQKEKVELAYPSSTVYVKNEKES